MFFGAFALPVSPSLGKTQTYGACPFRDIGIAPSTCKYVSRHVMLLLVCLCHYTSKSQRPAAWLRKRFSRPRASSEFRQLEPELGRLPQKLRAGLCKIIFSIKRFTVPPAAHLQDKVRYRYRVGLAPVARGRHDNTVAAVQLEHVHGAVR